MGYGGSELNKAHAMAAHAAFGNFHTTAFTNNAPVPHPFVLAAMAFPILGRAKNLLAKQPIHLRLKGAVIDGFRLGNFAHHLAVRKGALAPIHDALWGSERDFDVVEVTFGTGVAVGHGRRAKGGFRSIFKRVD